ncbi:MAG: hypothetical protein E6I49_13840 [Chloroflexi bacterium]|nr:MAG: hypothetical protein E6I49_13840 [Chloroflexota bacterium]
MAARLWVEGRDFRSDVSTWIDVAPEAAFAYVADMPRHREWAVHAIEVRRIEPGDTRLGSRFESRGKQGTRWWPSELEVVAYEPPRRFAFTATGGPLGTEEGRLHRHEFLFIPRDGGTAFELRRVDPILSRGLRFRLSADRADLQRLCPGHPGADRRESGAPPRSATEDGCRSS